MSSSEWPLSPAAAEYLAKKPFCLLVRPEGRSWQVISSYKAPRTAFNRAKEDWLREAGASFLVTDGDRLYEWFRWDAEEEARWHNLDTEAAPISLPALRQLLTGYLEEKGANALAVAEKSRNRSWERRIRSTPSLADLSRRRNTRLRPERHTHLDNWLASASY